MECFFCLVMLCNKVNNLLFSSLNIAISDDILTIIKLSMKCLNCQAMNILRNLYEIKGLWRKPKNN